MAIDGYLAATPYPAHFPREFAPGWIDAALAQSGVGAARAARGRFRYLDLGCGTGFHLLVLAAAHPEGEFVGTDADASSVARATALAAGLGLANLQFVAEPFAATEARIDAGWTYVTALGVLSWVSPENRARVLRIAGKALNPNGVLAVGYNTLPGRAHDIALQRVVAETARERADQGEAVAEALHRLGALAAAGARGLVGSWVDKASGERPDDPDFLPHEFLTEHWAPLDVAEVARGAAAEGLLPAGSLHFLDNRPDWVLTRAQRAIVEAEPDPAARARLVDLCRGTAFRRDLFRRPGDRAPADRLADWLAAACPVTDDAFSTTTTAGRLRFDSPTARAILTALQSGPARLDALDAPGTVADRLNSADALLAAGRIAPASPPADCPAASTVNAWILERVSARLAVPPVQVTRHGVVRPGTEVLAALAAGRALDPAPSRRLALF
ncbi:MAG: methyltransferase regulatory domain-containing protein [Chromatiales bacterium]|nr:methyltransferase regulatory domain-containing protein [Chromatiales bacterium]